MKVSKTSKAMVFPALLLAAAACSGTDGSLATSDVTELTASAARAVSASAIQVAPSQTSVAIGSTVKLTPTLYDSQGRKITGNAGTITWSSSDTMVAKVAANGVVTGISDGAVVIAAAFGGTRAASSVTVGSGAPTQTADPVGSTTTSSSTTTTPTTTPTTSQTTTSAPTSSSGTGVSSVALAKDDFTSYSSTAALLSSITANAGGTGPASGALYSDGVNASLVQLDPTTLYNGHPTMKYVQPGGTASTPWLAVYFTPTSHIWYRAKVRFSPGWTDTGTLTNSANAYKMLSWGYSGYYGSGRLELTNTNQYDFYWNIQSTTDGSLVGGGNHANAGAVSGEWTTGAWYDYIVEVDHSAGSTGVARIWMAPDGQTPVLKGTVSGNMFNGSQLPLINCITVGLNFNQTRTATQSQAIWWGQWEVVDGSKYPNPFNVR